MSLFIQCLVDGLFFEVAESMVAVLPLERLVAHLTELYTLLNPAARNRSIFFGSLLPGKLYVETIDTTSPGGRVQTAAIVDQVHHVADRQAGGQFAPGAARVG